MFVIFSTSIEDLPEVTCTDIKQQWGQIKGTVRSMYETIPFQNLFHLNKKSDFIVERYNKHRRVESSEVINTLTKGN